MRLEKGNGNNVEFVYTFSSQSNESVKVP